MKGILIYSLLFILMLSPVVVRAQDTAALKTCEQKDIKDVINSWRKNPKPPKPPKSGSLLLIPTITSNPATGVAIGAGGQYAFSGKKPGALYSSINGSATITTKKQFLFQLKNNIFLKGDNVFLSGDWRILLFSQSTYGLGTSAPDGGVLKYQYSINGWETADDSLVQPMKFNHIRFHQTISWRIGRSFFLGMGYHLDWMNKINDLKLDTALPIYTSHYLYSKNYGFDEKEYLLSGLSFNGSLDTRDNLVNPYKGIYANINWRLSPKFLGSKKTANILNLEWRSFHGLSASNPRHLLAFWFMGTFSETGKLPYLILPALGYDQRGRSGRGYTQGRFRGTNLIYSEAEYRFPISTCGGILGGVLFANMTTASYSEKKEKLFNDVAPGYGFGLRMMVDKKSKTNLQVDFGFGKHSGGVYFGASETF